MSSTTGNSGALEAVHTSKMPSPDTESEQPDNQLQDESAAPASALDETPIMDATTEPRQQALPGKTTADVADQPTSVVATPTTETIDMANQTTAVVPTPTTDTTAHEEPEDRANQTTAIVAAATTIEPRTDPVPRLRMPRIPRVSHISRPPARYRGISLALLLIFLLGLLVPFIFFVGYTVNTYNTYLALRSHASSGIHHLLDVKNIFTGTSGHASNLFDTAKLQQARNDCVEASADLQQVQQLIEHTSLINTVATYLPQYRPLVETANAASIIGEDTAKIGVIVFTNVQTMAPNFKGTLLSNTKTQAPLITPANLQMIGTTIDSILPLLKNIQTQVPHLSLNALPSSMLSVKQKTELEQFLPLLPTAITLLAQGRSMLSSIGWLLGVGTPRTFLVQTMDRAELRPTGGFTGQYGTLTINGGRVEPFSLQNIALVEYAGNNPTVGNLAPAPYQSWWPFANWGLRDSNLSADFPTSAKIAIQRFADEMGQHVDGVIVFTPFLIEHILQIIGPIQIPGYNETITAQNLENRLHYYQLDNAGIRKEEIVEHVNNPAVARKLFTSRVEHVMLDKVRTESPTTLLAIAREALHNLQTKDLQIYFSNQQLENLLIKYNDAAQIHTSTSHDGLFVVQANVSASKASQYVRTSIQDTVTLNAQGGATHVMQLHLDYTQIASVYGLDTYRDYVRVYVPPTAKFLWGDGFDTGQPLCDGPYAACPANGIYPGDELICPTGQYHAGASAPMLNDPYTGEWHPLDTIGPPTNFTSDMPGRAMFGGYIVVPKNCNMTATLSWYVPPSGHHPYQLLIQRQAGTLPELDLTILPTPGDCSSLQTMGMHFDGIMTEDMSFTPPSTQKTATLTTSCYPQPGV